MTELLSRRAALQAVGLGIVGVGCAAPAPSGLEPVQSADSSPPGGGAGPGSPSESGAGAGRKLSPKELLAGIEHLVVLVMENRSFDHLLGALALDPAYPGRKVVDGLKGTESNPGLTSTDADVSVFKMSNFTPEDPPHDWSQSHAQFNDGKNDGFVRVYAGPHQHEAMGFHDRSQIPVYYWLADNFTVCDRWFASVLAATWPNRMYLNATTSQGEKDNNRPLVFRAPDTIFDALASKNVSSQNYAAGVTTWLTGGMPTKGLGPRASIDDFFDAAAKGTLPAFSMIDPDYHGSDDHPSHNVQRGQAFVASIYQALAQGPAWEKTLFIITYDEGGGFYDHVPPPKTVDAEPEFTQLGFRVPALVIGPTVKKGYVCKTQLEHCSVAATLSTRWDIADLTNRMAASNDISDCINPLKVNLPSPPPAGMPQVAMTREDALYDRVGKSSQPMLDEMIEEGLIPAINTAAHDKRIGRWLDHAVRLGVVRMVGS